MKKAKKIIFECEDGLSYEAGLPPIPASKSIPEWYRKMPKYIAGETYELFDGFANQTVKQCTPFLDSMMVGYTYTLNQDVYVSWDHNGDVFFTTKSQRKMTERHIKEQSIGIPIPNEYHNQVMKWINYFTQKTPKGYSLLYTHPLNRFDLPFYTLSGFVDTDTHEIATHFPFLIKKGWTGIIEAGTPLVQFIPIKRESWESEKTLLDRLSVSAKYERQTITAQGSYKKRFWHRKSYK
jgi:hypothetical protein